MEGSVFLCTPLSPYTCWLHRSGKRLVYCWDRPIKNVASSWKSNSLLGGIGRCFLPKLLHFRTAWWGDGGEGAGRQRPKDDHCGRSSASVWLLPYIISSSRSQVYKDLVNLSPPKVNIMACVTFSHTSTCSSVWLPFLQTWPWKKALRNYIFMINADWSCAILKDLRHFSISLRTFS